MINQYDLLPDYEDSELKQQAEEAFQARSTDAAQRQAEFDGANTELASSMPKFFTEIDTFKGDQLEAKTAEVLKVAAHLLTFEDKRVIYSYLPQFQSRLDEEGNIALAKLMTDRGLIEMVMANFPEDILAKTFPGLR